MDFKLCPLPEGGVDLQVSGGDLVMDPGFLTALLASLWTDGRASLDDPVPSPDDLRGYWADRDGDRWGSLLWLLDRAKRTEDTLRESEDYVRGGLEWMRTAGALSELKVQSAYNAHGHLVAQIAIKRDTRPRWSEVWEGTDRDIRASSDGQALRILIQ